MGLTDTEGFTILEVMVAVVILGLSYVSILQSFSLSMSNIHIQPLLGYHKIGIEYSDLFLSTVTFDFFVNYAFPTKIIRPYIGVAPVIMVFNKKNDFSSSSLYLGTSIQAGLKIPIINRKQLFIAGKYQNYKLVGPTSPDNFMNGISLFLDFGF